MRVHCMPSSCGDHQFDHTALSNPRLDVQQRCSNTKQLYFLNPFAEWTAY